MTVFTDGAAVYADIVTKTHAAGAPVPIDFAWPGGPLKMAAHKHPYSIQPKEFDFIRSVISACGLRTGFEVATAFGISSLAAALGFKSTGGRLVTMDAYIEESTNDANAYRQATSYLPKSEADGFKSAIFLREQFGVSLNLVPRVGWSPDDVAEIITGHFGAAKLDFAFIDAGHWDEALINDAKVVSSYLGERYVVLFHDTPSFGPKAHAAIEGLFGTRWMPIPGLAGNRGGFDMALIAREVDLSPVLAHFQ